MRSAILLLVLLGQITLSAQNNITEFVWEGGIQANFRINEGWSGNTGLGKRSLWTDTETSRLTGRLAFYEFDQFVTRRISPFLKASGGYKFRWSDPGARPVDIEQRLTQQLAWIHVEKKTRWVSRFRTEQRFQKPSFAHRYRYRISLDRALSGQRLDNKEFYLSIANEILLEIVDGNENSFDNRISLAFGYLLSDLIKAEISATLRLENLTRTVEEITFFNTRLFLDLR